MRMKSLPVIMLLVVVLAFTACTRSASRPSGQTTGGEGELPFPTPADGTPDVMGTLLAGGFATQTAIAQQLAGGTAQVTGQEAVQATQVSQEAMDLPPDEEQPTQQPAQPTATPEPKKEPDKERDEEKDKDKNKDKDKSACDSPYTVKAGEWVYSIARSCGVEPQDIIAVNGLRYPYSLYPGDQLKIPGSDDKKDDKPKKDKDDQALCSSPYTVQAGEWVYAIARKCGTTPQAIINTNGLAYPYRLFPGDKLKIP